MDTLQQTLDRGEIVTFDGAIGAQLQRMGAPIIGGCCGIGPEHIGLLRHAL